MWGMGDLSSDHDLVYVYRFPTTLILDGHRVPTSLPSKVYTDARGREMDCSFLEIGHLVNLLMKGNVNAIWAMMSPILVEDRTNDSVPDNQRFYGGGWYHQLRDITARNLSKISYHSIKGVAESHYKDVKKRADQREPRKSLLTAIRTLRFGTNLMTNGILTEQVRVPCGKGGYYMTGLRYHLNFDVMSDAIKENRDVDQLEKQYETELALFERAYLQSALPVKVNPNPFRAFLRGFRLYDLKRSETPTGV